VAGGVYDMLLVVGGEKMPNGFIQTSGAEEESDPEYLRQRCVGMPGPAFRTLLCQQCMADYGTTEERLAQIAVKAHKVALAVGKALEQAGARQVPDAELGLGQTPGLGGNGTAVVLNR
jgi:acetyl-CoA acetyltransferase